jgi:DNA replication protein DnaC
MSGSALKNDGHLGVLLTELRLPTMKRLAADLCEQSDREGWPARRLLEQLLQFEVAEREVRRFDRHRAESGLDLDKRLSTFDFNAVATISKAQVIALVESQQWLDRGANILAFGAPGAGKSHLQELQKLDRFDLLILDDISYGRRDQAETSVLFELIAERYERKSIAIAANTPFSQWREVFVDAAMTHAAIDRLVHHATILEMNVESYRRRAAEANAASQRVARKTPPPASKHQALAKPARSKPA